MKRILLLLLCTLPLLAQDLAPFSDEFATADSLKNWTRFDAAEGWPDMTKRTAVADGNLLIEPWTSGWYAEFHAPFLYKEVTGPFMATARLRVRGREGELPSEPWSLAGLMVREPRPESGKKWEPRGENWLFLTTGIAFETGKPVFETKTTVNSRSNLKLAPARAGWVELRIVRVGPSFILLSRYEGEKWQVRDRFFRTDLPRTLQVGLNAYTGWNSAQDLQNDPQRFNTTVLKDRKADAVLEVDWVRFARPELPPGTNVMALTDWSTSDAQLLAWFGA
jgi:hypothetical protein